MAITNTSMGSVNHLKYPAFVYEKGWRSRAHLPEQRSDVVLSIAGQFRVGFLHFPICYSGALHGPAIHRITNSSEMRPWRLGTDYDRPIARRLAEEAGVPRANFGHHKMGGQPAKQRGLNADSERDFQDFLRAEVPGEILARLKPVTAASKAATHRRLAYVRTNYSHFALVRGMLDLLGTDRFHWLWSSTHQYEFHWGFEKIKHRYEAR